MTSDEQALVQQHVAVQYQAEVAYLDDELSAFWQALAERGALDRTLVLLLSDHGEQFWEHGEFRHAKSLHPGESDAIAAFWWNGVQPGHWSGATEQPDLLPTLFGALDISPPDGFTGQVLGRASPGRYRTALLASTVDSPSIAVDRNGLRLHYQWDGDRALFDLTADPAEQNDVYGSWNEESACLWDKVADEVEAARAWIDWEEPRQLTP